MDEKHRRSSGGHRMGLVECPACGVDASKGGCELCGGEGYVGVDAAIAWKGERDALPSIGAAEAVAGDDVTLLLDNVDLVLRGVATMPTSEEARQLTERALAYRRAAEAWQSQPPPRAEYDVLTGRVLGLHVMLRKMKAEGG